MLQEIKKNMKKYNATFSLEDKMRESKASKVDWLWLCQGRFTMALQCHLFHTAVIASIFIYVYVEPVVCFYLAGHTQAASQFTLHL